MDNTEEKKNISKEKTKKKKEKPVRVKKVKSAKPAKAPKPKKEKVAITSDLYAFLYMHIQIIISITTIHKKPIEAGVNHPEISIMSARFSLKTSRLTDALYPG